MPAAREKNRAERADKNNPV